MDPDDVQLAAYDEARNYERLKLQLAAAHPTDREAYTDGKSEYVRRITLMATRVQR